MSKETESAERVVTGSAFTVRLGPRNRWLRVTAESASSPSVNIRSPAGLATMLCDLFSRGQDFLSGEAAQAYRVYAQHQAGPWLMSPHGGDGFVIAFERQGDTCLVTILFSTEHHDKYCAQRSWLQPVELHVLTQRRTCLPKTATRDPITFTGWPAELLCAGRWHVDGTRPH